MTSRWLSFDRVLFSPAAEDILSSAIATPRILILDGLANDDWSSYCALTYPNATVYNLSTTPKLRQPSPHGEEWSPPPNHRNLPLPSLAHPFPFPKGFFAAVALRFPPLLPQHHHANIVAEAKRVLRSGGCLELTLLDIDPANVGPLTRRRIKGVKLRAQNQMADANFGSVSDAVVKLLGRKGFEGLKSCSLSVPVAGAQGRNSPDEFESLGNVAARRSGDREQSRSLLELLREAGQENSAGLAAQYPVAKTVSRVARWWWSRCYEGLGSENSAKMAEQKRGDLLGMRGGGETDERSIWRDPEVVQECEEYDTGLRLTLAFAVKPAVVRRRTASV